MASSLTKDAPPAGEKTFFGHPRGLATLFMTEMWERFSYYGLRALLVIYLISGGADAKVGSQGGGLAYDAATATAIYSVYVAMVYLLAMPGSWFGDRVWGPRKTVAIGAGVIMVGHLCLAIPGSAGFFVGLALVALGSGLLKSNISTMVGQLYADNDVRRDGGFTVFYMGINVGGFLAPYVIGTVGQTVNWHLGFALAALGMALGLTQFLLGTRHLPEHSDVVVNPASAAEKKKLALKSLTWAAVAAVFYAVVVATDHFTINWVLLPLTVAGLVIPVLVLVRIKRDSDLTDVEQSRMTSFIWIFAAAAVFWMIYDQGASTVQAFGETKANNTIFGWEMPSTWYQSFNSFFIILLAPVFAALWIGLIRRGREARTMSKFAFGLFFIALSFFSFCIPLMQAADGAHPTMWWIVLLFFVQTIGELCLSPVGLSVSTKLAPAKYASQLLGVWFLAVTAGDSVTGLLAIAGVDLSGVGVVAAEASLAVLAGLGLLATRKKVSASMQGA
ncbi:peptide MFS transporter [Streptomyces sp. NPDC002564]|uniref:peptide MFS transporter n=1 Tax=Streptomyces sp. NPDC002564 TaxID=3364649 RepID=UPI00368BAEC3